MPARNQPVAPRCMKCGYTLEGLHSPGECPECSRPFDLTNPHTYTTKPPFIGFEYWLPAWLLSLTAGLVTIWYMVFYMTVRGAALWIGVPLMVGCLLGYGTRAGGWVLAVSAIIAGCGLIIGFSIMGLAGVYCAMVLFGIFLLPLLVGTYLGWMLRLTLKLTRFSQRSYLPIIAILMIPPAWALLEGRDPYAAERVSTSRVIAAPSNAVWESLMFYEEVRHAPPLILRVGLARPLYTLGASAAPGDQKICVYNKGRITKQVVEARPGELLSFNVIDQDIGYERDVRLIGGSFAFEPEYPSRTRVTLTTEYEPKLGPRWCWRPFERYAVHTIHGYVLDGMAGQAMGDGAEEGPRASHD